MVIETNHSIKARVSIVTGFAICNIDLKEIWYNAHGIAECCSFEVKGHRFGVDLRNAEWGEEK